MSMIYELMERGGLRKVAEYSLPPKAALVAFIEQDVRKNFQTWNYPTLIDGMREGARGHWYYDDFTGKRVLAAYPA